MRYLDNGYGNPNNQTVFSWLNNALTPQVVGLRWQSGFFNEGVLGVLMPTLTLLAVEQLDTSVLIGSNNRETSDSVVSTLVNLLQLPRPNAKLGIVGFANGLYHPKTIHISYANGREVAYVGSANLTVRGISGQNVEAGILLDSATGDDREVLGEIKESSTLWFETRPDGLFIVDALDDVKTLARLQILSSTTESDSSHQKTHEADIPALPHRPRPHRLPPSTYF